MGCVLKYPEVLSLLDKGYLAEDSFAIGGRAAPVGAHSPSSQPILLVREEGPRPTKDHRAQPDHGPTLKLLFDPI